ncbi:16S rRNA (uracil(1498)-N(3))-methyltransferase [Leptolyngbya ohadii]|uniref:16S rRNA (uracil(1498)-N(3))-methyltransferase n=1 Tax=Leptolyngbya ohadii TaxID=1962290 RepID=UPI000B5A0516|nr:16S rRNA (uracil(1498)-N(3))-methyltransferase [Leptolyngbya ohadii]
MSQLQRLAVSPSQIEADRLQLTDRQQHYLMRVLRLQTGDRFIALDGAGHGWMAALQGREAVLLEPISTQTELPIAVTLLIALPKNGMDDIVRQATELGVSQIVPVLSARSLLNPSPQKLDRWQRIAQEAAEQSERQIVPAVLPPHRWQEALQIGQDTGCDPGCDSGCCLYLCEARGDRPPLLTCLKAKLIDRANWLPVTLAVGPEGGWTEAEVEEAIAVGYQPVSLGKRILRAVTAPIAALALVGAVLDDVN